MTQEEIKTSASDTLSELQEQMAALQTKIKEAAEQDAKEKQEILDRQRHEIVQSIEDISALRNPEAEDWERITNADCVGIQIVLAPGAEGEPPVVTTSLISKAPVKAARKASTGGGGGTRRDLEGEFRSKATQSQIAALDADKAAYQDGSKRGRQHGFMTRVVDKDFNGLPNWASEHGLA